MISIGKKLDRRHGLGGGFDALRIALAVLVVFWHSFIITPNQIPPNYRPWVWLPHFGALAMFFALSGFLISGSALRLTLPNFLLNRSLRILPALAVEIVLSAMVLGAIFTTLPLSAYFTSPDTYRYFTNIIALINFDLPGVFQNNPNKLVNGSLWTVPAEFLCYGLMSVFVISGSLQKPARIMIIGLVVSLIGLALIDLGYSAHTPGLLGRIFGRFQIGPTTRVTTAFIAGVALYQLRYRIRYSKALAWSCLAILGAVAAIPPEALSAPAIGLITALPFAYLAVFIGASDVPTPKILHSGDYSYGIYLYGFPVQQAVYSLTPSITSPWLQFLLALPPIVLFAVFSWHCIEKPILAQRRRFSFVAKVRGVAEDRTEPQYADGFAAPDPGSGQIMAQ